MRLRGIPVQYTYNSHVRHGWIHILYVTAYNKYVYDLQDHVKKKLRKFN